MKIDKNIRPPLKIKKNPEHYREFCCDKYDLSKLKKNDSFLVPVEDSARVRNMCAQRKAHNPGWNYITRRQPNGQIRIWRVS